MAHTKEQRAQLAKERIGQEKISNAGQKMKIIAYRAYDDIDVEFEDGGIAYHMSYGHFINGEMQSPNTPFYKTKYHDKLIGSTSMTIMGEIITLVAYRSKTDMDVQFEDGTIVTIKNKSQFTSGLVKNPNRPDTNLLIAKQNALNALGFSREGYPIRVIDYRSSDDIDVQFEDGFILYHKKMYDFNHGLIARYNKTEQKHQKCKNNAIGTTNLSTNGQMMKVIDYINSKNIVVEFEDGTRVNATWKQFQNGNLQNPNNVFAYAASLNESVLLFYLSKFGFQKATRGSLKEYGFNLMEIDCYNQKVKIAIEYDGFWHSKAKERDLIKNQLCAENGICLIRIREPELELLSPNICQKYYEYHLDTDKRLSTSYENIVKQIITEILNQEFEMNIPVDIINFSNDAEAILNIFNQNRIKENKDQYVSRYVGQIQKMSNGLFAEIITYRNSTDIDVQFEDGTIREHVRVEDFQQGYIKHPTLTNIGIPSVIEYHKNKAIGTTRMMNCGMQATIIAYRSCSDIDVQFEDGTIVTNKQMSHFRRGKIAHPGL